MSLRFVRFSSATRSLACVAALFSAGLFLFSGSVSRATTLLNETWPNGNRTTTNLPSDSPVYIGQSSGNGSNSVTTGHLSFTLPTNSLKFWTYFTSDSSAPDGNQPHNAVTQLGVGSTLTASATFSATGITSTTGKNFRVGLFFDPTDARVQSDVNSDGGGASAPWTDAVGYAIQLPITGAANSTPLQIEKRTTSNSSLLGSSGAYTIAPTTGSAYSMVDGTSYTIQLSLFEQSATDMEVTATLLQGSTVLATGTASDLGTSFGGTAIGSGLLPGSQGIYTNFDQLFFRDSDNTQSATLDFTNFHVEVTVPEPTSIMLMAFGVAFGLSIVRRRKAGN